MTGRRVALPTVLLLCALLAPTLPIHADGSADKAKELYARYQKLYGEKSWKKADQRMAIVRSLGRLPVPEARSALLSIIRVSKSEDEQLLAVQGLGSIADAETAGVLLKQLGKKEDPVLLYGLYDGLIANPDEELHAWLLAEGLGSSKAGVQRAVIRALGALKTAGAAAPLQAIYKENAGKRARIDLLHDVVRALGQIGQLAAEDTLLAAAGHEDGRVRLAAAEALARAWADVEPYAVTLRALLEDPEAVVRRTAAYWIGESGIKSLVPYVIQQLEDPRLRNRKVAHDALVKIAGKDLGYLPDGWIRWWKDRNAEGGGMISVAKYYGFQVFSDRVLFIVDTSGSMNWPWRWGPKRIEYAREKLAEVLAELGEDTLFNIIAYSTKVHSWQRKKEVPATEKNVEKALKWIEKNFAAEGDTHTFDALAAAFANNARFDTVYLLSDGTPSHGRFISPEGIVTQVEVWNRYRRVVINTIALTLENLDRGMPNFADNLPRMKSFMAALAASTGGATKAIENAPKRENR